MVTVIINGIIGSLYIFHWSRSAKKTAQ